MSLIIHFTNEASAWQYLLPALFDFKEFPFDWEFCRFQEGIKLADRILSRDNIQIFSAIKPGHEQYVIKWLKLNGLPLHDTPVYFWTAAQENPLGLPCIRLPTMLNDQNDFILGLKSRYPLASLISLRNERSLDIRQRQYLSKLLSPALAKSLANQFNSLSTSPATNTTCLPSEPTNDMPAPPGIPCWAASFDGNSHLPILLHIDQFDVITEVEVNKLLGSVRSARKFTCNIEKYSSMLPFGIKVQSSPTGKRYTKNPH